MAFIKGIQLAQQNNFQQQYALLLGNLANIYYLKKDTAGIKYALECYELGHSMRNPYIIYSGAVNSAYMYFLMKQNEEAMKYIHEAETLMLENDFYDQAHTYNLFGNILYDMGEYASLGILQKSQWRTNRRHKLPLLSMPIWDMHVY